MATSKSINIVIIGTLDTKLAEFLYLRSQILDANPSINIILVDAGRSATTHDAITITQPEVYQHAVGSEGASSKTLGSLPRGEVIKTMIKGATSVVKGLLDISNDGGGEGGGKGVHGVVSLGGSGGTSIAAAVMRSLPLMLPKLIVSTVASGDTSSYVAESDITMMYSVVDIAGLNEVLRTVIRNAALAIAGMAQGYYEVQRATAMTGRALHDRKKGIGITMFGVTTPAANVARRFLDAQGFEVYVFHATGAGGRASKYLIAYWRTILVSIHAYIPRRQFDLMQCIWQYNLERKQQLAEENPNLRESVTCC